MSGSTERYLTRWRNSSVEMETNNIRNECKCYILTAILMFF